MWDKDLEIVGNFERFLYFEDIGRVAGGIGKREGRIFWQFIRVTFSLFDSRPLCDVCSWVGIG